MGGEVTQSEVLGIAMLSHLNPQSPLGPTPLLQPIHLPRPNARRSVTPGKLLPEVDVKD